jgi:hypothetical protein
VFGFPRGAAVRYFKIEIMVDFNELVVIIERRDGIIVRRDECGEMGQTQKRRVDEGEEIFELEFTQTETQEERVAPNVVSPRAGSGGCLQRSGRV